MIILSKVCFPVLCCLAVLSATLRAETGVTKNVFDFTVLTVDGENRFVLDQPRGSRTIIPIEQGWFIHEFEPGLSELETRVWTKGELRLANGESYELDTEMWFEGVTVSKYQVKALGLPVSTELQVFPDITKSYHTLTFKRPGKTVPWEFNSAQYHAIGSYAFWSNGGNVRGRLSHQEALALVDEHYGNLMAAFVAEHYEDVEPELRMPSINSLFAPDDQPNQPQPLNPQIKKAIKLTWVSVPGDRYEIQESVDLKEWETLKVITATSNEGVIYIDSLKNQHFRIKTP